MRACDHHMWASPFQPGALFSRCAQQFIIILRNGPINNIFMTEERLVEARLAMSGVQYSTLVYMFHTRSAHLSFYPVSKEDLSLVSFSPIACESSSRWITFRYQR